jgi:hypothetical protein
MVKRLDRVHQRWSIVFPQKILTDFNCEIWPQSDEVAVERRMVQRT